MLHAANDTPTPLRGGRGGLHHHRGLLARRVDSPAKEIRMALRGKTPEAVQKRLKMLLFGPAGSGKTTASIQFPRPYLIDTERGAENDQYVKKLKDAGGAYYFTTDPADLMAEVRSLLTEKHDYRTLVIDPLTVIYNDLLDAAAQEVGTDFGKHKGPANRTVKRLLSMLLRLDMNVIITSHAKPKWVRTKDAKGKDTAVQEGITFDCYDGLDYLFDLVIEVGKRGKDRVGTVRKTRLEGFPEGEVFPFNYQEIAAKYGAEIIEREAQAIVLATPEQARELAGMIDDLKDGDALRAKWLKAAGVEDFTDMTAEQVSKCIAALQTKKATVTA